MWLANHPDVMAQTSKVANALKRKSNPSSPRKKRSIDIKQEHKKIKREHTTKQEFFQNSDTGEKVLILE